MFIIDLVYSEDSAVSISIRIALILVTNIFFGILSCG